MWKLQEMPSVEAGSITVVPVAAAAVEDAGAERV